MKINVASVRNSLKAFDFQTLFREHLGWDKHQAQLEIPVDGNVVRLTAVAQKRGFVAFVCPSIPDRGVRLKIDHQVTKSAREHFIIYADQPAGRQVWQWVRREPGKPLASRDHRFDASQSGDALIQRLEQISVALEEEEKITVVDVAGRARAAFDVEKVTKKFYEQFKDQHTAFMKFIKGLKGDADLQWYTSLMLNRLMFVYFIQKKGFLDGDPDYLRSRLKVIAKAQGKDKFQSFYRYFLLRLFHDGLGKAPGDRQPDLDKLLGKVPYLNGGFFEVHQLEERNTDIDIPDKAFEKLFDFFDQYSWHLDERPLRADNEINPDVVGYIFEKYINQKQMGAYYTKEDITEYIGKSTIIPFLFDAAEKKCAVAFKPESALWRLLRDDPDRYVYAAVRHGVIDAKGSVIPLPKQIDAGVKDVAKRDGWNKPAPDPYGLPTETWREHVARRTRCLELRQKLQAGEVHAINDLVTLNLDIWQFARDAIVNSEGPELLRAFWHAIEKVTVLDPTCGSGAFLFAGLRILETLYSDCLERMERFVEDLAGKPHHPEQFSDFKTVLEQLSKRNARYFILKSIIINNLFGVDIMEEAVEICKLRLFLKLVAQVETVGQIEPLPDIDFNIRAGNTLVGFASLEQVRRSQEGMLGFGKDQIKRIEEDAELVERSFRQFRAQQTTHGGKVTRKDKQELRTRLTKLDAELDRYLARESGVNLDKPKDIDAWKASHEPFHWLVEFYGIMHGGGFDVIIGNPPYVEYASVKKTYTIKGYATETCGNLYAFVLERCFTIAHVGSRTGMIVQLPMVCTDRMIPLQRVYTGGSRAVWFSTFDDRPGRLFDGLEHIRATIAVNELGPGPSRTATTKYNRWLTEARESLFETIRYCEPSQWQCKGAIPKVGSESDVAIASQILRQQPLSTSFGSRVPIYFHNAPQYWVRAMTFKPYFWNERDGEQLSSHIKTLSFASPEHAKAACAVLNSTVFYWWYVQLSNCRDLILREIERFPLGLGNMSSQHVTELVALCDALMRDLKKHAKRKDCVYKATGKVSYDEYFPRHSKSIIDGIDKVLAKHFGLSEQEVDYVVNYDIKYRLGADVEDDED